MATFKIGTTYSTRSACDHNCVFSWTVIKRTAKFITVEDRHGKVSRCGVKNYDNVTEWAMPQGSFSMCPVINADSPTC